MQVTNNFLNIQLNTLQWEDSLPRITPVDSLHVTHVLLELNQIIHKIIFQKVLTSKTIIFL